MKTAPHIQAWIIFLFILFGIQNLPAQIVCTDVNPDLTVSGNATTDIDMNNDLTPDFRITSAQAGILSFVIVQAGQISITNSVLANGANGALALAAGSPIGPGSNTWVQMNGLNQTMIQVVNSVGTGPWVGVSDQYLGVAFVVGLNTYYGWARFSFSANSNTYVFKDYAYNSIAGQQILAGQSCASATSPVIMINGNLCVGNSVTLTANTGTDIPTTVNWLATPPGATFAAATSVSTTVSFSAAGTYSILLVVTSGTAIGFVQNTVSVGFTPTMTSNSPVCSGQSLTLSAGGGTAYVWSLPPSGVTMAAQSITVSLPVSGIYTVTATSAQGCTANATSSITVKPLPTVTVSANSVTICVNSGAIMLAATGNASQYSWSPPQGLSATVGQVVSAAPLATTVYTITASLNSCTSAVTSTVNVLPQPLITASGATLCLGQQAALTATLTPAAVGYTWTGPAGQFTMPSPSINVNLNNIGVYTVTANSAIQGCTASVTVTLDALPDPVFTVSPVQVSICPGNMVPLTATGNTTLFSWSPAQGLSGTTGSSVIASPTITTVYTATGSLNTCTATGAATINVQPAPVLTLAGATVCLNQPAVLNSGGGAGIYTWAGPGGFISATANPTVTATSVAGTGIYTVICAGLNGCVAMGTVNLMVSACTGSKDLHQDDLFTLYPNPVMDRLYVETACDADALIEISDATGKLILKQHRLMHAGQTETIPMDGFSPGLYLVKINIPGGKTQVSRIIK